MYREPPVSGLRIRTKWQRTGGEAVLDETGRLSRQANVSNTVSASSSLIIAAKPWPQTPQKWCKDVTPASPNGDVLGPVAPFDELHAVGGYSGRAFPQARPSRLSDFLLFSPHSLHPAISSERTAEPPETLARRGFLSSEGTNLVIFSLHKGVKSL